MCGRFTLRTPLKDVVELFDLALFDSALPLDFSEASLPPRYNIAPSQQVACVRFDAERQRRTLDWLQWGLIPRWADDPAIGNRMINARGETVATKPAFREAFRRRRCLLPADGFYEWKRQAGGKQPYYIQLQDKRPFAFAGLWEHWRHGELAIDSCTIITTAANALVSSLHDRMPVILDPSSYQAWLDPQYEDRESLEKLLIAYPTDRMTVEPVSRAVNNPRNDSPRCIEPAAPEKTQGSLFD
jgi:putative SOS response-associated peptidase YedK